MNIRVSIFFLSGIFRPILMQLDLQHDGKYFSVRSHELLPRQCWKLALLASQGGEVVSKIYPELFAAYPGTQLQ